MNGKKFFRIGRGGVGEGYGWDGKWNKLVFWYCFGLGLRKYDEGFEK